MKVVEKLRNALEELSIDILAQSMLSVIEKLDRIYNKLEDIEQEILVKKNEKISHKKIDSVQRNM